MKNLLSAGSLLALPLSFLLSPSSSAQLVEPVRADGPRAVLTRGGCDPPLPAAGQTILWTAALNPVRICSDSLVPSGAKVVLGPGVRLVVEPGVVLTVDGELQGMGTPAAPLDLSGDGRVQVGGFVAIENARVDLDIDTGSRATLRVAHATVPKGGDLSSFQRDALVDLEDVVVESGLPSVFGMLALRDVTYLAPNFPVDWSGYFLADGVVVQGSPLTVVADHQPRLLADVDVLNPGPNPALSTNGGGINPGTNVLIEGTCDLVGGSYPVQLRVGGLHPESVLPPSGNTNNAIALGGFGAGSGVCDWPDLGIPYQATDDVSVQGRPTAAPGARFQLDDFAGFEIRGNFFDDTGILRGAPGNPLRIEGLFPGANHAGVALFNATAEYLDVDGGPVSSIAGFNTIRELSVHDSPVGIFADNSGFGTVRGCRILDNLVGATDDPTSSTVIDMNGAERPNFFSGNTVGARNNFEPNGNTGPFPAQNNWWGAPSGPLDPFLNPNGQGDPVEDVEFVPWLTAAPDLSDTPPYLTLDLPFLLAEPGDTVYVSWDASDDGQIVSQRILMDTKGGGVPQFDLVQGGLDGSRRSAFVQVPFIGQNADARSTILRVEAIDDAGNVGRNDITLQVPVLSRPDGEVTFLTDVSQGFVPGEEIDVCYDAVGIASGSLMVFVVLDTEANTLKWGPNGFAGLGSCTFSKLRFPRVSTNRARLAIFSDGIGNDNDWYFSEPFEIRPLERFPDAPPQVQMLSPLDGQRFAGGGTLPVSWSASDDEGLREFRVQVSLNDGRAWSTVETLPGTATSYDWQLPTLGTTLDEVRVRVVAVDHRFQATADGDERVLGLDPGTL